VDRYWLAHDLQEGSMGLDMPTPWKMALATLAHSEIWQQFEDSHSKIIHQMLGLEWPVPAHVKKHIIKIDAICLATEGKYLFRIDDDYLNKFCVEKPMHIDGFDKFVATNIFNSSYTPVELLITELNRHFHEKIGLLNNMNGFDFRYIPCVSEATNA
ncbi:MAG: hypothetical protein HRU28_08495, partial [Rhizobiales bacterium]|nr:hypothetical protein [Hyphomicrobiales bacterium]